MEVIIIGDCGEVKRAMMEQALKERCVLIGVDFGNMSSTIAHLNMSFKTATIATKIIVDSINKLKAITPDRMPSFRDHYFRDEALKLRSIIEGKNTIVYEKQPSKFISRPINNFRKR